MKRKVAIVVLLLIAGAAMNLGFAWMIAWTQRSTAFGRPLHGFQQWGIGDKTLNGSHMRSPGAEWLLATCWNYSNRGSPMGGTPQQFIAALPTWLRAEMLQWCGSMDAPDPPESAFQVFAAGWPARSFYVVRTTFRDRSVAVRGGWSIPRQAGSDDELLPYAPIWRGVVVNTAVYAALLFVFSWNLRTLIQWNRYRRGRCPRCRYDLRFNFADGCSECGWKRVVSATPST